MKNRCLAFTLLSVTNETFGIGIWNF